MTAAMQALVSGACLLACPLCCLEEDTCMHTSLVHSLTHSLSHEQTNTCTVSGDPKGFCSLHSDANQLSDPLQALPASLLCTGRQLLTAIASMLRYVSQQVYAAHGSTSEEMGAVDWGAMLAGTENSGLQQSGSQKWHCVLHNDDVNSFQKVHTRTM